MTSTDQTPSTTDPEAAAAALAQTVDTHLAGYCEPDPVRRVELLAAVWAPDGELIDPPMEAAGVDGIAGLTDVVLAHYPGHTFRRTTTVDAHHTHARYGWALVAPDGSVAVTGTDVIDVDADGRLVRVVGFFGEPTAAAA